MKKNVTKRDKRMDILTYLVITIVYLEMGLRVFCSDRILDLSIVYIAVFSLVFALGIKFVVSFLNETVNRILTGTLLLVISAVYIAQAVYRLFFGKYMVIYSMIIGGVEQVANADMLRTTLQAISNGIVPVCVMLLPFLYFCIFGKRTIKTPKAKWGIKGILTGSLALCFVWLMIMIGLVPEKEDAYKNTFDADILTENFGLAHMGFLDFKLHVLRIEPKVELEQTEIPDLETPGEKIELDVEEEAVPEVEPEEPEVVYEANVMDIDFEALLEEESNDTIRMLHEYFKEAEPTYKNAYTGMFEGYNLITITAEGFSPYAVDERLTPTLYKMMSEGFQFTNFYTPIWGVSTSDGEYVSCTGLLPKSGVWSFYESSKNDLPFCLGNQFEKIGVNLRHAYHNHTYNYYHRDESHPNMGYTYKGLGNGFTTEQIKKVWPESDVEMIEASVEDYLQTDERFVSYYMTVSGHLEYSRVDNSMSYKNWDLVKDMDASETVKAYMACNIELDRAMETLLAELEKAGVADKTLIAIVPDHYPYGLESTEEGAKYKYFNELLGHEVETNFELYKSICILYSPSMEEPIVVDRYCANVDLLPTVSNLLGLEYDSRLLVGKDMLSDSEQLLIFSNRSWISEYGRYNKPKGIFEAFDESVFGSEEEKQTYVESVCRKVEEQFKISSLILNENYYEKVIE